MIHHSQSGFIDYLENETDIYLIAATTHLGNQPRLALTEALNKIKDYIKKDALEIYQDHDLVFGLETKEHYVSEFVEKVYSDVKNNSIQTAQYYWEHRLSKNKYESITQFHLYCIVTVNKELLREKQNRYLRIQIMNANFNKDDALVGYLESQKMEFNKFLSKNQSRRNIYIH